MSTPDEAAALFKALAHPARVLLVRLTWEEARSGEALCALLQLSAATVSHHLAQLDQAGLMLAEQQGHHRQYRAHRAAFPSTLASLVLAAPVVQGPAAPAGAQLSPTTLQTDEERARAKVLAIFLKGGKLIAIPAQRKKRDIVLEALATEFEPGRDYPEREVNGLLSQFHPDFFTLRRELVGRGLLTREKGVYTRPVAVAASAAPS